MYGPEPGRTDDSRDGRTIPGTDLGGVWDEKTFKNQHFEGTNVEKLSKEFEKPDEQNRSGRPNVGVRRESRVRKLKWGLMFGLNYEATWFYTQCGSQDYRAAVTVA